MINTDPCARTEARLAVLQGLAALSVLCALAACGGGGGDSAAAAAPSPAPAPAPPAPPPSPLPDTAGARGPALEAQAIVSRLDVGTIDPQHSPTLAVPTYAQRYFPPGRRTATGDFNGDGKTDMVVCPSYFSSGPLMGCEFWLNDGSGKFRIGTSEVYAGAPIRQAGANSVLVADFNGDGRPDVFIVAQGPEANNPADPEADQAINHVLLSRPDGKLEDATATALPLNPYGFHHPSAMGDLDGDGDIDLAICELGGRNESGVFLLVNDGTGRFSRDTASLPDELRALMAPPTGALRCGTVAIADLDGDGRAELIAATYIGLGDPRELRIYRRGNDGSYSRAASVPYPAGIATESAGGTGFGAAGMAIGDLDGDGRPDIGVLLESIPLGAHLLVYRNQGGLVFTDVTTATLGSSRPWPASEEFKPGSAWLALSDLDGDGKLDLTLSQAFTHPQLADYSPFLLNDGNGVLRPWVPLIGGERYRGSGGLNDAQWTALLGIPYTNPTGLLAFDATGDGRTDWVFFDNLVPNPLAEPARLINGSSVDFVVFLRVLPQVAPPVTR